MKMSKNPRLVLVHPERHVSLKYPLNPSIILDISRLNQYRCPSGLPIDPGCFSVLLIMYQA